MEYEEQIELIKEVPEDGKVSGATIQAELYRSLSDVGIASYLEYPYEGWYEGEQKKIRLDCVIFNGGGEIICAVEVKSYKRNQKPNEDTKQFHKYREIIGDDFPLRGLSHLDQIEKFVKKIEELLVRGHFL